MRGSARAKQQPPRGGLGRSRARVALIALAALVVVAWALAPGVRGLTLVATQPNRSAPDARSAGFAVESVRFQATDGVALAGWLAIVSPAAPTVILVHGFKGTRAAMLPYARFLVAAGYNVLLFDERGCGQSAGWHITLGVHEPDDVLGAVRYLTGRADLKVKRFGALGISLGAGVLLLAAAREPALTAVVADSAWADEQRQLARMSSVPLGPLALPVLPYEPALVDALVGGRLAHTQPLAAMPQIAPRAVMLIHSADDSNTTTSLSDEHALYAAASDPKVEWVAPSGGHAGALAAHTAEYQQRVLAFFLAYLNAPSANEPTSDSTPDLGLTDALPDA